MKKVGFSYSNGNISSYISSFHKIAVFLHPQMKNLKIASNDGSKQILRDVKYHLPRLSYDHNIAERQNLSSVETQDNALSEALLIVISTFLMSVNMKLIKII